MNVKELIEAMSKCNPEAVVLMRRLDDNDFYQSTELRPENIESEVKSKAYTGQYFSYGLIEGEKVPTITFC